LPVGLSYRTEGHNLSEAVSRPTALTFNGQDVTGLQGVVLNSRLKLDSAKAAFNSAGPKDLLIDTLNLKFTHGAEQYQVNRI
jgi:hypothetical protein